MTVDEAIGHAIDALKKGAAGGYGYDYFAYTVALKVAETETSDMRDRDRKAKEYFGFFEEAGWVLCQRGVLRPGAKEPHNHVADPGYSLTASGEKRLDELDDTKLLIYQSNALIDTFRGFEDDFGAPFVQRAVEAVRCRDAGVCLASCVMSGAAAEAVLLAIATAKTQDEAKVLKTYRGAHGRREVVRLISGSEKAWVQQTLKDFSGIISAWRDEAGHGATTEISNANADEALRQLLHMCQWVKKEWDRLTAQP